MVSIEVSGERYSIPTEYSDIDFLRYASVVDSETYLERSEAATGIPADVLAKFNFTQMAAISPLLAFLDEEPKYIALESDLQIGSETYGKMEEAKMHLKSQRVVGVIEVAKIYLDKDIGKMSVAEGYGYAAFFLTSSKRSANGTSD